MKGRSGIGHNLGSTVDRFQDLSRATSSFLFFELAFKERKEREVGWGTDVLSIDRSIDRLIPTTSQFFSFCSGQPLARPGTGTEKN